jgi:hypothetical protein
MNALARGRRLWETARGGRESPHSRRFPPFPRQPLLARGAIVRISDAPDQPLL